MKTSMTNKLKMIPLAFMGAIAIVSCDSDDDAVSIPPIINEEEVITTIEIQLTNDADPTNTVLLRTTDADGDGPNPPVDSQTGDLFDGYYLFRNGKVLQ